MKNQQVERKHTGSPSRWQAGRAAQKNHKRSVALTSLDLCVAAEERLDGAVSSSAALLEAIAILFSQTVSEQNEILLGPATVEGLAELATQQGENLRNAFDWYVAAVTSHRATK